MGLPTVIAIPPMVAAQATRTPAADTVGDLVLVSPLWQVVVKELAVFDFGFAADSSAFTEVAAQEALIALQTVQQKTPSPRTGADILVTVDVDQRTVVAIQYIFAGAQAAALEVHAVRLTPESLVFEEVQTRGGALLRPGPRVEQHWSFPRSTLLADLRAYPLIEHGWPDDAVGGPAWHYSGVQGAAWQKGAQGFYWAATTIAEQFASDTARAADGELRIVNLALEATQQ